MSDSQFVVDGYERAVAAVEPEIRANVYVEYAEELAAPGFFRRLGVRWRLRREIARRVALQAPAGALY